MVVDHNGIVFHINLTPKTSWNQRYIGHCFFGIGTRHSPNHIHMICLSERWKTTLKSFGSCIGGMIFKPFWHTAKLCLVLTKTSACLSRLKVLRPNGCQTQVVLKPVTGWDHDIPIRKATKSTAKFFPYELHQDSTNSGSAFLRSSAARFSTRPRARGFS